MTVTGHEHLREYLMMARLFGVISLVMSLGILINIERSRKLADELITTASGYIVGGVLPLVFGGWVLVQRTQWEPSRWGNTVALVGLFMFLIGVFRLWFVKLWKHLMIKYVRYIPFLFSLLGLVLASLLLYIGYVSPGVSARPYLKMALHKKEGDTN